MNLPLNGRIAIIDNNIDEAFPLMEVFSKNQMPYVYYKGDDVRSLPEDDSRFNDVRLLFLDINLLSEATPTSKQIKSSLFGVLKRIISPNNYPYALIYWSKQEAEYSDIVYELFENELKDRAPITIKSFIKSDFFTLDGNVIENEIDLLSEVDKVLSEEVAYSYLLNWENKIHLSVDKTLQEIFSSHHSLDDWKENANYVINKLGISYSGKKFFNTQNASQRIISSYNALNLVFIDSLENGINTTKIENAKILKVSTQTNSLESVFNINKKLLISNETEPIHYTGTVIEYLEEKGFPDYEKFLEKNLKSKNKSDNIKENWKRIWLNVTPLCDTVQGNTVLHRIVRGILVEGEYHNAFFQNEAVFVSPLFYYEEKKYFLVLDFRHFFTLKALTKSKNRNTLFRIRQQLLAEVQSRLSRHVNRQGILFLDEK